MLANTTFLQFRHAPPAIYPYLIREISDGYLIQTFPAKLKGSFSANNCSPDEDQPPPALQTPLTHRSLHCVIGADERSLSWINENDRVIYRHATPPANPNAAAFAPPPKFHLHRRPETRALRWPNQCSRIPPAPKSHPRRRPLNPAANLPFSFRRTE
jgi:hypothetical protein